MSGDQPLVSIHEVSRITPLLNHTGWFVKCAPTTMVRDLYLQWWPENGMANRIEELRLAKGLTKEELGALVDPPTSGVQIGRLEREERSLRPSWIRRLAKALGVDEIELTHKPSYARKVPVVGYVGAGMAIYPNPETGPWVQFDEVDAPPGAPEGSMAVRVKGGSMAPMAEDGDTLVCPGPKDFTEARCLNRLCVVQVAGGPAYVKKLRPGTKQGRYTLWSLDGEHLENVKIEWAMPVRWIDKGTT